KEPQAEECASSIAFKESSREVDREAAGQQTDREEDGCLEHVARRRSCEALPDIIEIGNDENREDGGLGEDEGGHTDCSTIRKTPSFRRFKGRGCDCIRCAHCSLPFLVSGPPHSFIPSDCPGLRDASGPTTAGGWRLSGWKQSCMQAAGSLQTIRESMRPRDHSLQCLPSNKK